MAIKKKLIHFKNFADFNSQKLSANEDNTSYTIGPSGAVMAGEPNILYSTVCWIKDTKNMWTHGTLYSCSDVDLSGYLTEEEIAGTYATKTDVSTALANLVGEAPETLDTIEELSSALKNNADIVDVLNDSIANKQDKVLKFENVTAGTWVSDSTYEDYPYRCDISCTGVTSDMYAEVVFALEQATSGNYAPLCETKTDAVSVWSTENTIITVPTILITK